MSQIETIRSLTALTFYDKKVSTPKPMCHDFATKLKVLKILIFSFIKFF
jgi:hypothetical protein